MPNVVQFSHIGNGVRADYLDMDRAICQSLGFEWNEKRWVCRWYNIIVFSIAMGRTIPELKDRFIRDAEKHPEDWEFYLNLIRILHFLLENYTVDTWYEVKR